MTFEIEFHSDKRNVNAKVTKKSKIYTTKSPTCNTSKLNDD